MYQWCPGFLFVSFFSFFARRSAEHGEVIQKAESQIHFDSRMIDDVFRHWLRAGRAFRPARQTHNAPAGQFSFLSTPPPLPPPRASKHTPQQQRAFSDPHHSNKCRICVIYKNEHILYNMLDISYFLTKKETNV